MASKLFFLVLLVASASSSPFDHGQLPDDPPPVEAAVGPLPRATDEEYRLPEGSVEVSLYEIELRLVPDTFNVTHKYDGTTVIRFKNLLDTNTLKFHADVHIVDLRLTTDTGTAIGYTSTNLTSDPDTNILTLTTATPLIVNADYVLTIEYVGDLRTNTLSGFYKSTYVDAEGNTRVLGTTQFESTSARKAFPCFDEPSYKAQFDLTIIHPVGYNAISNTQETAKPDPDDPSFIITTFALTPIMPTYLLAFVVSDFTCTPSTELIDDRIVQNVCSRDETSPIRALAVEHGPPIVKALEEWTSVFYNTSNLTKLHQFAIPDFSAGAMENWGLITYRENYLLWDPEHSSNSNKQNIITVIAHELAHFWFGNLVTCHWWSDIFLNEGFATYFEYHIAHEIVPLFELDKQFVLQELQPVLVSDASPNSAALSSPAYTQQQASDRFSSIAYNKGGSILRMVQNFMGTTNFKAGINKYLIDNQLKNTRPEHLWSALQTFAPTNLPTGQTIPTVMENWTVKPGFPVINVTVQNGVARFTQTRYLSSGNAEDVKWYVPVTYTTSSDANKFRDTSTKFWLTPTGNPTVTLKDANDWIILNNQQIGYYRVDYDDQLWEKIKEALNKPAFDSIHEMNRAQLIDDYFNFARDGRKSFAKLLELLTFLKKDTSYYTWNAAFNVFSYITQRLSTEKMRSSISAYILELAEVLYSSLPFDEAKDENQIYSLKRAMVIPWICRMGLQDCADRAVASFASYRQTEIKPHKDLRATTYCNALRYSTNPQNDFNWLWDEFLATKLAAEQSTILSSIGCIKDPEAVNNLLRKSIDSNSGIRQQDTFTVFQSVYVNNPEGVDLALDFLVNNYQAIVTYYGSMNSLTNLFSGLAGRFSKREQTDKFAAFIETENLGTAETAARTALNTALANLENYEKFEQELNLYFAVPEAELSSASTISTGLALMTTFLVFFYQMF